MSADEIKSTVLEMADSDPTLSEDARLLILGALGSDDMFADVLRGEAGPIVRPDQTDKTSPAEPVGAYLRSITVSGFRGIGPEVRISLLPGPGLVVIAGRNGSDDELGGVLDGRPSELYDKLFVLSGLERITVGRDRLSAALHRLSAPQKAAKSLTTELKTVLLGSDDPRSSAARTLITKRQPNVAAVQALVTGSDRSESNSVAAMRSLTSLSVPEQVSTALAADRLRQAVAGVAAHAGTTAEIAARQARFLEEALALHDEYGDRPCPVCGVGPLDAEWARRSRGALDADRAGLAPHCATLAERWSGAGRKSATWSKDYRHCRP